MATAGLSVDKVSRQTVLEFLEHGLGLDLGTVLSVGIDYDGVYVERVDPSRLSDANYSYETFHPYSDSPNMPWR